MIEFLRSVLNDSVTIFTIMNPLSAGVIMLSLLDEDVDKKTIQETAFKNSKAVFIAMIVTFLLGTYIFSFFGISPNSLQVFGGLILLFMGFNMVQGFDKKVNHTSKEHSAANKVEDISIVPLAIPIIVGPGLASTLISIRGEQTEILSYVATGIAILICSLANFFILRRMPYIKRKLGINGLKVMNRLMGLVVGALAAQMIMSGISELYKIYF